MLVNLDTNNHTKMARQNSTTPIVEICCNLNRVDSSNQDYEKANLQAVCRFSLTWAKLSQVWAFSNLMPKCTIVYEGKKF